MLVEGGFQVHTYYIIQILYQTCSTSSSHTLSVHTLNDIITMTISQGRTNKLVDRCYSFWQGGLFPLIHAVLLEEGGWSFFAQFWGDRRLWSHIKEWFYIPLTTSKDFKWYSWSWNKSSLSPSHYPTLSFSLPLPFLSLLPATSISPSPFLFLSPPPPPPSLSLSLSPLYTGHHHLHTM